jgi:hypothetical protein
MLLLSCSYSKPLRLGPIDRTGNSTVNAAPNAYGQHRANGNGDAYAPGYWGSYRHGWRGYGHRYGWR